MKLLILLAGLVAAVAVGGTVAYALDGGSSGSSTTLPSQVPTTSTSQVDVSGPCDEAEHANDPRCTGAQAADDVEDGVDTTEDISGPCDEAEHANDPRCTGGATDDDDRSGPSDDSGPWSGSGHGGSDDDDDDDNSGPGGGGSSGSGSGDDD